jgi:alanine transaminase
MATRQDDGERFSLNLSTINPNLKEVQYAVRGPVLDRAMAIDRDLARGTGSYPFKEVIYCNIGDVQAMGHQPITYIRQLIAVCLSPGKYFEPGSHDVKAHGNSHLKEVVDILAEEASSEERERLHRLVGGLSLANEQRAADILDEIPRDVKERANVLLNSLGGSYTDSQGISVIRQHVAEFITRRDGPEFPGDPARLFLLNGATEGIKAVFYMCMDPGRACGVMIPIPQYPIYTASISEFGARKIEYYLDEEKDWAVDVGDMRRRVREARSYCQPRILAVINPGNPTGQCLAKENIREIVQLCREEGLVIIADEVYQENIYDDAIEFTSFRKVVKEMGADDVQLVSIHSVSKGYTGECGVRGGYMELLGFDNVMGEINKLFRTKLCPNTMGQVVTDAMVYPPQEGSPSYELYKEERKRTQVALRRKADLVCRRFNSVPGVSCRRVRGAMYAFPQIHLPPRAIEEAKKQSLPPDQYYCMQFLEKKGVCVVPGSGFGQKEGTWHFRTTILPSEADLEKMLDHFADFHVTFTKEHS